MNDERDLCISSQTMVEVSRLSRRRIAGSIAAAPLALGLALFAPPAPAAAKRRKKNRKRKKGHGGGGGNPPGPDAANEQQRFLALINNHRAANGHAALAVQDQLDSAAGLHSQDQAAHNLSSHTGSNGSTVEQRFTAAGYGFSASGENIYWNSNDGSASAAFDWWRNSPLHNANMLSATFTQIGIGRAQSSTTGSWYWTTTFGRP